MTANSVTAMARQNATGSQPIPAQAFRRSIKILLPPSLAEWAALAKRLRSAVNAHLPVLAQQRAFWERLADQAFAAVPGPGDTCVRFASARVPAGRVTLVEAGSGGAALLTLNAVRAL